MKKFYKVLSIILICLAISFGIYTLVSFIVNKDGTMYWINYFVDLINKPLPIVGVTTAAILIFIWRLFVSTKFGKNAINEIKSEYQEKYNSLKEKEKELELRKQELEKDREENKENIKEMKECIIYLCSLIPNKKVNDLGDKFSKGLEYGNREETIDIETKAD